MSNIMKKFGSSAVVAIMLLGMAGCGASNVKQETTSISESAAETEATCVTLPEGAPGEILSEEEVKELFGENVTTSTEIVDNVPSTEDQEPTEESVAEEDVTEATDENKQNEVVVTEYEKYQAMSPDEQVEFFNSFASPADFVNWYNTAKAEYEALHPDLIIEDGSIDLSEIIESN